MPNVESHRLAATTLVRLIGQGELTAEAVVESCLARIAEREPVVRAWAHLAGEAALAKARERDRSGKKTLLNGYRLASRISLTAPTCRPPTGRRSMSVA